jgi:hypothetical protein
MVFTVPSQVISNRAEAKVSKNDAGQASFWVCGDFNGTLVL